MAGMKGFLIKNFFQLKYSDKIKNFSSKIHFSLSGRGIAIFA
jgi:hypothetical protein